MIGWNQLSNLSSSGLFTAKFNPGVKKKLVNKALNESDKPKYSALTAMNVNGKFCRLIVWVSSN